MSNTMSAQRYNRQHGECSKLQWATRWVLNATMGNMMKAQCYNGRHDECSMLQWATRWELKCSNLQYFIVKLSGEDSPTQITLWKGRCLQRCNCQEGHPATKLKLSRRKLTNTGDIMMEKTHPPRWHYEGKTHQHKLHCEGFSSLTQVALWGIRLTYTGGIVRDKTHLHMWHCRG